MQLKRRDVVLVLASVLAASAILSGRVGFAQEPRILFSHHGEELRELRKVELGDLAAGKYVLRMTEYTMEPGANIGSHTHKGPGLRYVLEGAFVGEFRKGEFLPYRTADTYFEPAGFHYGGHNPGPGRVRVITVELLPAE